MDDYVFVPHHGAVQGSPDDSGWDYSGQLPAHAEKWGGGNAPLMYDPPSGWRYGFPKVYAPEPGEVLIDTLARDGYPRQMAEDFGVKHCRFFESSNDNTLQVAPATRRGDFMQTFTGKQVWPMDMRAEDVDIQDIAHSLAMQCRYAGHCLQFLSVAEHCVHVSDWLLDQYNDKALALAGLLHDASEAYLCDVPSPVKPYLAGYKDAEAAVQRTVHEAFGLPADIPEIVHEADNRILIDERIQNMAPANYEGGWPDVEPLGVRLQFWSPAFAKAVFLMRFSALTVGTRSEERRAA